jgi:predicted kinase
MDAEKIQKINKLAKSLKDTGIAHSMDDAVTMAEKMVSEGELPLREKIVKQEPLEEEEIDEKKEPFILKKPEEKPEEVQEEISDR